MIFIYIYIYIERERNREREREMAAIVPIFSKLMQGVVLGKTKRNVREKKRAAAGGGEVVVFGSINLDVVMPAPKLPNTGETVLATTYSLVAGGKGANQALAAKRAGETSGVNVKMIGATGNDAFATIALANLKSAGVNLSSVAKMKDERTGCAAVLVDESSGDNQIVVGAAANLKLCAKNELAKALCANSTKKEGMLVMQMEAPTIEVAAAIVAASEADVPTLLNVAPSESCPDTKTLMLVSILVVNEHEALAVANERLANGSKFTDAKRAALALALGLDTVVVVTLGAQGAEAFFPAKSGTTLYTERLAQKKGIDAANAGEYTPEEGEKDKLDWFLSMHVDALTFAEGEAVVDTVGAGDAFVGALAAGLVSGNDLGTSMARATCAGGITCMKSGAQDALPNAAAIDARVEGIAVTISEWPLNDDTAAAESCTLETRASVFPIAKFEKSSSSPDAA